MSVKKTAPKWYEEARRRVGKEDEILKSYEGYLDDAHGYLVISKKKVIFIKENGLFKKTVKINLDLPYNQVGKVSHLSDRVFDITEKSGKHHTYQTDVIRVSLIEELLREHLE